MLPSTPTTVPMGISYGWITSRPMMSQASTKMPPSAATHGMERRMLSPSSRLTALGTIRPRKGMAPAVTTTTAEIADTMSRPASVRRAWFRPRFEANSRPMPATV